MGEHGKQYTLRRNEMNSIDARIANCEKIVSQALLGSRIDDAATRHAGLDSTRTDATPASPPAPSGGGPAGKSLPSPAEASEGRESAPPTPALAGGRIWYALPEWDRETKEFYAMCPRCGEYCGEAEDRMTCLREDCQIVFRVDWETE